MNSFITPLASLLLLGMDLLQLDCDVLFKGISHSEIAASRRPSISLLNREIRTLRPIRFDKCKLLAHSQFSCVGHCALSLRC